MWANRRPGGVSELWRQVRPSVTVPLCVVLLIAAGVPAFSLTVGASPLAVASAPADAVTPTPSVTDSPLPTPLDTPAPTTTPSTTTPSVEPSPTSPAPTVAAPSATPSAPPATAPATTATVPAPMPTTPAPTTPAAPAGLSALDAVWASLVDGAAPTYLAPGAPLTDVLPFQSFRLDVLVANGSAAALTWTPRLEYRVAGSGSTFQVVPSSSEPGVPFHATAEWVAAGSGTQQGPASATLDTTLAHLRQGLGLSAVVGYRASGPNPDARHSLPGLSAAEQEFSVEIGLDAAFGTTYELRVTDAGRAIPGWSTGLVTIKATPPVVTSPGQRSGVVATAPASATRRGYALLPMLASAPTALGAADIAVGPVGTATIHQPFATTTSDQCAVCHSTHRSASRNLGRAATEADQCYTCHGPTGMGGPLDAQTQFGAVGANDPATRSYYSHDVSAPGHTLASENEFGGALNRHSQCSDCHNPHNLSATPDTYAADTATWTVSGSYGAVTGVSVTNGAAGTTPTYALLDGSVTPVTAEYQVCLKCHSGFTALPANDPAKPSRDFTDVGRAFNPANLSFHPVEAAGKNQTTKMADSLAGTSQYKIWDLLPTDTIRCVMCHTSDQTASTTAAAANLPAHASANRGILIRPYEDRVLTSRLAPYSPGGFALCLACHAETPFMNPSGPGASTATNFDFHGLHVAGIRGKGGGGTDIDTPGAGQGNALCAECHFRTHSTTDAVPGQTLSGQGLVNFARDVTGSPSMGGGPNFTKTATGGTCTLTCHGKDHQRARYVS